MRVASGTVVLGQIVLKGEPLPDGSVLTILAGEADETFELDSADEEEILASIAEADRGELIPAEDVLASLRNGR